MAGRNDKYEALSACKDKIVQGQLVFALEDMRKFIEKRSYLGGFISRLDVLDGNYRRMAHFYQKGSEDPRRTEYFKSYREEAYRLVQDLYMAVLLGDNMTLSSIARIATPEHAASVKEKYEGLITEYMEIARHPNGQQDEERARLLLEIEKGKVEFRATTFALTLFSPQWDDVMEDEHVENLIASNEVTALVMVSAIMLGNLLVYDFRKLRALFRIYRTASSRDVRERAFVGAMFCLNEREKFWVREQAELVQKYCSSEEDVMNVLDFQKQIIYLLDTEKDTKKAMETFSISAILDQNTKLRELAKDEKFEMSSLEELISPEEEEELFGRMEDCMKRYAEMEKEGSDLYFKGFCRMKDFDFFQSISNWFTPFYAENPVLHPLVEFMGGNSEFLKNVEKGAPFCSGDTYSFTLVLMQMSKEMPFIKNLIKGKTFKPREELSNDEVFAASLSRRKYMQDVYRFFMLAPMRGCFIPLFQQNNECRISFLASSFFNVKQYEKAHLAMCRFLARRKDYNRMGKFLKQNMPDNKESRLINAAYIINCDAYPLDAIPLLESVLAEDPACKPARVLMAKSYYFQERYQDAITAYEKLLEQYPNHVGLERRIAVCHIELGEYDRALEILFKLDYLHPGDIETMRELARGLFLKGSAEKALRYNEKILAGLTAPSLDSAEDFGHGAMCKWATGDFVGAIQDFAKFMMFYHVEHLHAMMSNVKEALLQHYNIGEDDMLLMVDAASLAYEKLSEQEASKDSSKDNQLEN